MIRAALVDDNSRDRDAIESMIMSYGAKKNLNVQVLTFPDGEDILTDYTADYDIIFLDVEMQFLDGMRTAEQIRSFDPEVVIVFITCNPNYAMKGYKVNALDYILKPVKSGEFYACMDRVLGRLNRRRKNTVNINVHGGVCRIDVSRITYLEVMDHDLIYHTLDGNYQTKGTISEAEKLLGEDSFTRCNRSYLVNLEHVSGVHGYDLTVGGDTLQISRTRRKAFLDALNDYMEN